MPDARLPAKQAWWLAGLCAMGFALVLGVVLLWGRAGGTAVDVWWNVAVNALHAPLLTQVAVVLNDVGGNLGAVVVATLGAIALLLAKRVWPAILLVVASLTTYGVAKIFKVAVSRPRPEDMMLPSDFGSFPSGHSSNAMVLAIVVVLLFGRRWWVPALAFTYVAIMMLSRTYLHEHWITDTIAGALLGASVTLLVWAMLRRRLTVRENRMPRAAATAQADLPSC